MTKLSLALLTASTLHAAGTNLWSLQPVVRPPIPAGATSSPNPIDAFIWEALRDKGLKPAGPADRATLLRRVYLDLTGLAPTPEEVRAFTADPSPDAYEKVVDRLLSSEQHGVRYARHWLDVLRYTDIDGYLPAIWGIYRWRDWVISALNRDLPYDRFVRAQIAGDLSNRADDVFATGFLARGALVADDKDQELAFGAVETISTAFLAMTVGCARCHDHRFEPISQRDFYAMKALFDPLVLDKKTLATAEQMFAHARAVEQWEARRSEIEKPMNELIGPYKQKLLDERIAMLPAAVQAVIRKPEKNRTPEERKIADDYAPVIRIDPPKIKEVLTPDQRARYDEFLKALKEVKAPPDLPTFHTVREDPKRMAAASHILDTGDPEKPRDEVKPGFPFAPPNVDFTIGRRQAFLDWLTAPENPLFARVAVNRLWQWHFGEGLVATSSDFGNIGDKPTHPRLLDWLASEFASRGYSMRAMHRLMVTSAAYKMASWGDAATVAANARIDPKNQYLSRFRLRRLEAEAVRDQVLALSGDLDLTVGGMSFREGPPQYWLGSDVEMGHYNTQVNRRGIYMGRGYHQDRSMLPAFLEIFDAEDGRRPCTRRLQSVTAPQALSMMNGELAVASARKLAVRLERQSGGDLASAVELGYLTALSRTPSAAEKDEANTYLAGDNKRLEGFAWMLLNLDEFLYVR